MITKRRLLAAFFSISVLFAGCGQANPPERDEMINDEAESVAVEAVSGRIREINGNEIILALGDWAEDGNSPDRPAREPGQSREDGDATRGEQRGQNDAQDNPGGGQSGGRPQGGAQGGQSGGRPQGGQSGDGQRGQGGQNGGPPNDAPPEFVLSGDEKNYTIPVTATITTGQGDNRTEIRFTQLAVKNVVRLDLDSNGEIISIEVLQ